MIDYNGISILHSEDMSPHGHTLNTAGLFVLTSDVNRLAQHIHAVNVISGWWSNQDETPRARNDAEMICLMHSELSEALEGVRKGLMDDKIPTRPMVEVEMADTIIRILDYCGGRGLDIGGAIWDKLFYNVNRADHKPENRYANGGKKI